MEDSGPTLASGPTSNSNLPIMEESSDKLFCCRWVRHRIPLAHREELYHILRMTGPLLLSRILNYLLPFVITMFCGRLGNAVLAGYGLACATINVTTAATGGGLALACDTLVSQTFGGKNLQRVGVILQRSVLILLLFCLPCWAMLLNTQSILLALGQEPEVARIAQLYVIAYLPAVPAIFLHQLQASYLQNQGIILPQMYTAAAANIANVVTNYILLYWMDLGVVGSAAANTLSQLYICSFLFAYICWKKLHVKTWGGWTTEALQEWGSYMKLAIPSTLMLCFEWWIYELGGFLAGMLSEVDLAAQHVVMMLAFINYMFPMGIQAAACVRVGNALGAGDTAGAILTSKVSLALSGFWLGLFICVILQSTFFITVIFRLNWKRMTEKAVKRAGKAGHMVSMRNIVAPDHTENSGRTVNGYISVSTEGQEDLRGSNGTPEVKREDGSPSGLLSTTQLVLRRGLTVLAAIVILVVGTSVHLLLPLPISSWSNLSVDWSNTTFTTTSPPELTLLTVLI
ncbi:multidrug and toxin extrusion protein 1-like isoform X2 [Salvelinus alpinus]|uniref:multidrug and toxin extrusion protein 1-like isoform X2 n=1 Tax=Salvelinus alpinus TaxID=8036 RepID=UPI0039FD262A